MFVTGAKNVTMNSSLVMWCYLKEYLYFIIKKFVTCST